jgi:hypothetical protein
MSEYKKIVLKNSPVAGAEPIPDFLDYGEIALNYADNKIYYKSVNDQIVVHETPDIDIEPSPHSIVRRNLNGSGVFNGVISSSTDGDIYSIYAEHNSETTARIINTGVCTGAEIYSGNGVGAEIGSLLNAGANIYSQSGAGAIIHSIGGLGAEIYSQTNSGANIRSISGIGADISSESGLGLRVSSTSGEGASIETSVGDGLSITTTDGIGLVVETDAGAGANIHSTTDVGAEIYTESGPYHATFGVATGDAQVGVSSAETLDWILLAGETVTNTGKLIGKNISGNRTWTLPDATGTLLIEPTSSKTIYVDSSNGTDTRGSTSKYSVSTPFATIGEAVAVSEAGDLVRVRPGSYIITSAISLNEKGDIYFEVGTSVTVSTVSPATSIVAFACTATQTTKVYGYADFTLSDATAKLVEIKTLAPKLYFQCNSIGGSAASTNIFTVENSAELFLKVHSQRDGITFTSVSSVLFSIKGLAQVFVECDYIKCGKYLVSTSVTTNSPTIISYIKTLNTTNTTSGIDITSVTKADFYVDNYSHDGGVGLTCAWTQDTINESIAFINTIWRRSADIAHITMSSTASGGAATKKKIKLIGTNTFVGNAGNTAASISATTAPANVYVQTAYAATAPTGITQLVGTMVVNAEVNNF